MSRAHNPRRQGYGGYQELRGNQWVFRRTLWGRLTKFFDIKRRLFEYRFYKAVTRLVR